MLASRTKRLRQSDIRAISALIDEVSGINLGQGICDMPVPSPIKQSTNEAVNNDHSTYSHYAGVEELRLRILGKIQSYNRIPATAADEIVVGVGATGVFVSAVLALFDPGDDVILFEPYYGYHKHILELLGCTTSFVRMQPPDWNVTIDEIESAIRDQTKAIVVTTPSNPCGKMWTTEELTELVALAKEHSLTIITDEIYEYILYDGAKHISPASLPDAYERTVTISGLSKTFNMTGWRLGYAVAQQETADAIGLISDLLYICAPTPLQHGVIRAFEFGDEYYSEMQSAYHAKRELICSTLSDCGFDVPVPAGAYYVLADFGRLQKTRAGFGDDREACETLIRTAGIGSIPGTAFYVDPAAGSTKLRFCFAKEMPVLEEACDRLRASLAEGVG